MSNNQFRKNIGNWIVRSKRPMAPFRNGQHFRAKYKAGNVGNQIHSQPSVLDLEDPEAGDLVMVPVELFLSSNVTPTNKALPPALAMKFLLVDVKGSPRQGASVQPTVELFCVEDLDAFVSLSADDYEVSMGQTKLWDIKPKYPGLHRYDYIVQPTNLINSNLVELFLVAWHENDSLSVVPGIIETRTRKHWFTTDHHSQNIYRSLIQGNVPVLSEVDLPVVGMLGTVLEKRLVSHDFDLYGNLISGVKEQSWFYRILLRGRRPMWFQGPVWKCPNELVLPIYLPIP